MSTLLTLIISFRKLTTPNKPKTKDSVVSDLEYIENKREKKTRGIWPIKEIFIELGSLLTSLDCH